jgi:hypothetical protein
LRCYVRGIQSSGADRSPLGGAGRYSRERGVYWFSPGWKHLDSGVCPKRFGLATAHVPLHARYPVF